MNRLVMLAVAALAATATAQDPAIPLPRERVKIELPDAPQPNAKVNVVLKKTGRVETIRGGFVQLPGQIAPANVEQVTRQALEELRPIFRAELRLLTSAIDPTPSQRREIALEAGRTLRQVIASTAKNNPNVPLGRVTAITNDPRKLVRNHFEIAAWPKMSPKQAGLYRTEVDRKTRARREVVVLNVVASLDKHLSFDANQREKLCEALRSDWDDRDYPSPETSVDYDAYVPMVPDQSIVPILTEGQRKVWRGLRKVHLGTVRVVNPPNAILVVEPGDVPEDEDVTAALAEPKR